MPKTFRELANLNRLVHEPARLAILTALAECESTDFVFLQRAIGMTPGNLNAHLTALSNGGLVSVDKRIHGRMPQTSVALTDAGRQAIEQHWKQLADLRKQAGSRQTLALLRPRSATTG